MGCGYSADGAGAEKVAGADEVICMPLWSHRISDIETEAQHKNGESMSYHVLWFLGAESDGTRAVELDLVLDQAHVAYNGGRPAV